jgi:1-acyl-sn-glycerol-3-phosphate acyltransferase
MNTTRDEGRQAQTVLSILEGFARESRIPEPPGGIGPDTRMEADLGLDSLSRSELISRIERGLGITLSDQALLAATVRDLLELVRAGRGSSGRFVQATISPQQAAEGNPASATTLLDALQWHLDRHQDRTHILLEGTEGEQQPISYRGLADGATRVAARLQRAGLQPGGTVALMLPTGSGYFYSFFGALMAGGIPVPIYPPTRPQQIEEHLRRHAGILENAGAAFLITVPEARAIGRLLRVQVRSLRGILTLDGLEEEVPSQTPALPRADDIAFLQYTSGSTGDPKGVILTHADLLANIRAMGEVVQVAPEDVFVSWLPLYHDMGLIGAWLGSLYYGLPLISISPLAFLARPIRWLQAIHRHRGTLSAAPNFGYELCLTRIADAQLEGLDLSHWRWALNGAEPVSPETLRRFAVRFAPYGLRPEALAPVYGLAEAAVGLAFPPPNRGPRIDCIDRERFARSGHALAVSCDDPQAMEVVACGRPLPGYRVRIVDEAGRERPERHEGLLEFQGPSATQGYYRNPKATQALIRDGWLSTGDRAYLAAGDVHLTGRVKDVIIRGGRNIYPYEVEQALGEVDGVRKGCVVAFAATDPVLGSERLVILAESKERDPARRTALAHQLRRRATDVLGLPPDELMLVPPRAVLKTSSGKLRRAATRDRYLAGRLSEQPRRPLWQLLRVAGSGVRSRLGRLPEVLYAGYAWVLFWLIAPWFWIGVMISPRAVWRWPMVRAGIRLLRRLAFVGLSVEGREHLPAAGVPFVLVANHESYLDALALVEAVERPIGFVAKRELVANPFVAAFLRNMDAHFVDRFDPQAGSDESTRLTEVLAGGATLGFFPEGTFREQPGLLPFRMGAFAAAAAAGAPIVPAALRGTRELMRGDSFSPRPGRAEVIIGPPIQPVGSDWEAAIRLRDQARAFIADQLDEPSAT